MYKLFIGLKQLGKFNSILEAKQHAARSGLWGVFNLLGTNGYRDSWYVFESEAKRVSNIINNNDMITIKDITGETIEVTDLDAAIEQCKLCKDSPYKMSSGHTVGENHAYMLAQLEQLKKQRE